MVAGDLERTMVLRHMVDDLPFAMIKNLYLTNGSKNLPLVRQCFWLLAYSRRSTNCHTHLNRVRGPMGYEDVEIYHMPFTTLVSTIWQPAVYHLSMLSLPFAYCLSSISTYLWPWILWNKTFSTVLKTQKQKSSYLRTHVCKFYSPSK